LKSASVNAADKAGMVADCSKASVELPQPRVVLEMRVDYDVLEFCRNQGWAIRQKSTPY